MKRKRPQGKPSESSNKRTRTDQPLTSAEKPSARLLRHYYGNVCTLRQYLASRISTQSKHRRRCILHHASLTQTDHAEGPLKVELDLLDETLVGWNGDIAPYETGLLKQELVRYQEQATKDLGLAQWPSHQCDQADIIDFCLWKLRHQPVKLARVKNILLNQQQHQSPGLPCTSHDELDKVYMLAQHPWTILPGLVGKARIDILVHLFLDCGIFVHVPGTSNQIQVSGPALNDFQVRQQSELVQKEFGKNLVKQLPKPEATKLTDVLIMRHRMFYALPELTRNGKHRCGLKFDHILNDLLDPESIVETLAVMKHVFPQQFGLQNAFSKVPSQSHIAGRTHKRDLQAVVPPRRLQGESLQTINTIRRRHKRTSYSTLLQHHCPPANHVDPSCPLEMAADDSSVSAFCRAAVYNVFGRRCFGGIKNWQSLSWKLDRFVRLRRFEHMNMHEVLDGISVRDISWLAPARVEPKQKLSIHDFRKRKQLLAEFLYFLFNDFIISLIRSNFYVTESNSHRNHLLYFRHDVWRLLSQPAIHSMRTEMMEKCSASVVKQIQAKSALGISYVRFTPKASGMRPIVNLRRKLLRQRQGVRQFGRSINNTLAPAFNALTYEKSIRPDLLGSAMFSIEEIFPKLQAFRQRLNSSGQLGQQLYFARLDIKSCFDSLPHERLLHVARKVLMQDSYSIAKYTSGRLLGVGAQGRSFAARPVWKYASKAGKPTDVLDIEIEASNMTRDGRTRTTFVDLAVQRRHDRRALLELLQDHVENNLVMVDGTVYRQKKGIAQGSIVSSLLCSLLYAELEEDVLGSIDTSRTLLVRLIDDFLLISTERDIAERFMHIVHAGLPEFGVEVKLNKSKANFDLVIGNVPIPRLPAEVDFPYCGQTIHTVTLDLGRDAEHRTGSVADSVTVEYGKAPGQAFHRRTLQTLRLQFRKMLISSSYNSPETVMRNVHCILLDVAQRTYHYLRTMSEAKQPLTRLVIGAIDDVIRLAKDLYCRMQRGVPTANNERVARIGACEVQWLTCMAFLSVFQKRQTQYQTLLAWLRRKLNAIDIEHSRVAQRFAPLSV